MNAMEYVIIIGVLIVLVIAIVAANTKMKSSSLGEQVTLPGNIIFDNLMILTPAIVPFQNGVSTTFMIYENGIMVVQGQDAIEVPWNAITEIEAINHSHISTQGGSVLGGAAVGGILMGEVGALIGGLSGLQSNTVKGHLFYMSFNYSEFGLTTFSIHVGAEIFDFMNLVNQFKNQTN
jgi:uncharacterized protein YcfJ